MVLWDVIGQEELDKSLREGGGLPGTGRSFQERKMRKGKGRIFFQDGMSHSVHFGGGLRSEPLDLLEPVEGKSKRFRRYMNEAPRHPVTHFFEGSGPIF